MVRDSAAVLQHHLLPVDVECVVFAVPIALVVDHQLVETGLLSLALPIWIFVTLFALDWAF